MAATEEDVSKLLRANYIKKFKYPEWLSNVVLVKKASGKWRMCIDFNALNRACLKDSYPLAAIYRLVDASLGHHILSFMDAFSGMNLLDQEKLLSSHIESCIAIRLCPLV